MLEIVQRAAQSVGGIGALAERIGRTRQALYLWRDRIPAECVLPIEPATDGAISRHEMRPDLYPPAETGEAA